MLAVLSGISQRVPQITPHDVAEIDAEVRGAERRVVSDSLTIVDAASGIAA
jgi:hypothetical protein